MDRLVLIDCDGLLYKNIEDLDEYKDRIDETISAIINKVNATHYKCFLEVRGNQTFRKVMYNDYKAKRPSRDYHNREEIREYLMECYDPYISAGVESDDSIISTYKYVSEEHPFTDCYVAGNDKDYLTHPIKYIDLYHGRWLLTENISKEDAKYNFVYQMLRGDVSDNVPGLKGIGDAKAKTLLKDLPVNNFSYKRLLLSLYKKQYKSYLRAKKEIEVSYNLLRIRNNVRFCKSFNEVVFED